MIPLHLSITGFLSYHQTAEVDFTKFNLACIAGANGAGKSSLLDAITWALFGQARKRDDSVINNQADAAEVCLTFSYEGNVYRVQRSKPRDKTTMLEFQILQVGEDSESTTWKVLTERTLRETEARIQETLRLDYETFVNAAFFLQGKADQFTQQRPADRKRILGSILGLEIWETYRQRAWERRKSVETEIHGLDGRLKEIDIELDEEEARKKRFKQLSADLERLSKERGMKEASLETIRKIANTLAEQRKLVDMLGRQLTESTQSLEELQARQQAREQEKAGYAERISASAQIESAYQAWIAARANLQKWEEIAGKFREQEKRRVGPRDEINALRARLLEEQKILFQQQSQVESGQAEIEKLHEQIAREQEAIQATETRLEQRAQINQALLAAQQALADAKAENPRLRKEMNELDERIQQLKQAEGATCPLCGGPLSDQERQDLIERLNSQGTEMGDRYRANQTKLSQGEAQLNALNKELAGFANTEREIRDHSQALERYKSRLEMLETQAKEWGEQGAKRLEEIRVELEEETFAPEARARLAEIDAELKAIGYDATAHDQARKEEMNGRAAEEQRRLLERARAALEPLERELDGLHEQCERLQAEVERQQKEHAEAAANLAASEAQAPDLEGAERELYSLKEQENELRLEVGAAQQKVLVLQDLKERRKSLKTQREALSQQVKQYKQLERAFGKDGVPALLIEQALPEIEAKSNEILERLSGGNMSVRFVTQAAYKDKKRDDLKETLDIQISDNAGPRDYEMFSGGEAFRVNFAIRLALSEVLAQRAGARLQTLVIDEGFGSQDTLGRQRLIEAINLVRPDFAKILVITHIDELKDAFPNHIEVEKTEQGSRVQVL